MGYHVILAAQADRDLEGIVRFLARKNAAAAERLGHALLDEALSLTHLDWRVAAAWAVVARPIAHARGHGGLLFLVTVLVSLG